MRSRLGGLLLVVPVFLGFIALAACGDAPEPKTTPGAGEEEDSGPPRKRGDASTTPSDDDPPSDPPSDPPPTPRNPTDAGSNTPVDAGPPPIGQVFGHSASKLYKYDPIQNTVTEVGAFDCVPRDGTKPAGSLQNDSVIDIAVDATGQMYGTTFWRFIKIDRTNGKCTVTRTDTQANQYPNSLGFVPVGGSEMLVGYAFDNLGDATIYTRIDLGTGVMTDLGQLNPSTPIDGKEFAIAGDVITVSGASGKSYGAIKQVSGSGGSGNDLLAEIDPASGVIKQIVGDIGQKELYGVGYAGGKAYGFSSSGKIFEIDLASGSSTLKLDAKDTGGASIVWFGAGTTAAGQ